MWSVSKYSQDDQILRLQAGAGEDDYTTPELPRSCSLRKPGRRKSLRRRDASVHSKFKFQGTGRKTIATIKTSLDHSRPDKECTLENYYRSSFFTCGVLTHKHPQHTHTHTHTLSHPPHTHTQTNKQTCIHTFIHTYMHACMHACIHPSIHTHSLTLTHAHRRAHHEMGT